MDGAEFKKCLVCGSVHIKTMPTEFSHAFLVQCSNCSFVFCSKIPTIEELIAHYSLYRRGNEISPVTIKRYHEILDSFEPYRQTGKLLDVGCGDGYFLDTAKKRGWEVYGTEFTDEAITVCQAKGIRMHKGKIQDFITSESFDVITSFEVLEHINDGKEHVASIKNLLRNGGLFYFTTPNFSALSRRILGGSWTIIEYPEHLCYYTAKTMNRLLSDTGFSKRQIRTTGFSLQRFSDSSKGPSEARDRDEKLRVSMEEKSFLHAIKNLVNFFLSLFRLGDTLKGYYVK